MLQVLTSMSLVLHSTLSLDNFLKEYTMMEGVPHVAILVPNKIQTENELTKQIVEESIKKCTL